MQRRIVALVIAIVAVLAAAVSGYVYLTSLPPNNGGPSGVTMITIPQWSYIEPSRFNVTYFREYFATGPYPYPVNITVTIGVNNTIEWVNKDT
jgi:hypothetical protein